MQTWRDALRKDHGWLVSVAVWLLVTVEGAATLLNYISVSSGENSKLLFGFSLPRLAAIAGMFALTLAAGVLGGLGLARRPAFTRIMAAITRRRAGLLPWLLLLGLTGAALLAVAGIMVQDYDGYFLLAQPALVWLTLVCFEGLLLLLCIAPADQAWPPRAWPAGYARRLLISSAVALAVLLATLAWIAASRMGIAPDDRYWNEAGVPILGMQLFLAWIASMAAGALVFARKVGWKTDLAISLALWLLAAVCWTQIVMPKSYFAPGKVPPNYVVYPYSDALLYDQGAQQVLIGAGLNQGMYTDKPFYLFLLAIFHIIAGQDYLNVVRVQSLFLAIFPVILYWIGRQSHSRTAGLLVGLLAVIKETNAIAASQDIQVSHTRLMMTEFPTAVGVALVVLLVVTWLRGRRESPLLPLLAGGVLGAVVLIRTNAVFLAPFILLLFLLAMAWRWRPFLRHSAFFVLGMLVVVAPWFVVNRTPEGASFLETKLHLVFEQRYDEVAETFPAAPAPTLQPTAKPTAAPTPVATLTLAPTVAATTAPTAVPTTPPTAAPTVAPTAVKPGVTSTTPPTVAAAPVSTTPPTATVPPAASSFTARLQKALEFVPKHFFHNLAMATLILPISPRAEDVMHLDAVLQNPWWVLRWDGSLSPANWFLLLCELALLALGLGAAWNTANLAGLMPACALLGYYLANAFGRTSGSRYLVPADWVIYFYAGLGLAQLGMFLFAFLRQRFELPTEAAQPAPAGATARRPLWLAALVLAGLVLLGIAPVVVGRLFPVLYPPEQTNQNLIAKLPAEIDAARVRTFLAQNGAVLLQGRMLYPRFYGSGEGEPSTRRDVLNAQPYPRQIFLLLGSETRWVILPIPDPTPSIRDASETLVLGCRAGLDIQAQVVVVMGETTDIYTRDPAAAWTCPLEPPTCTREAGCH